jgi:predicted RNA-binding protein with PIN domain
MVGSDDLDRSEGPRPGSWGGAMGSEAGEGGRARWVVDGMNLIGSRPDRWWNDPDAAVRRLIDELGRYAAAFGEDLTVVFDRRPRDLQPGRHGPIEVGFASSHGRNAADHEIVRMVAADPDPSGIRVVTSDRRLRERVTHLGASVTSAGTFRRRVDQALGEGPAG